MKVNILCTRPTLLSAGGEWALIHGRNTELIKLGVELTLELFIPQSNGFALPNHLRNANYPIHISTYSNARFALAQKVKRFLSSYREDHPLLFSGRGFALFPVKQFNALGNKLIIDVHGAIEEIYEHSKSFREPWDRIRAEVFRRKEKAIISNAGAVFVVSDYLKDLAHSVNPQARVFRVPCSTTFSMNFEQYLAHRRFWRNSLGIPLDACVIAYSGSLDSWQCVREHLDFVAAAHRDNHRVYALFCVGDLSSLSKVASMVPGIDPKRLLLRNFDPDQLKEVLCSVDFGLLLRHNNITNRAAFPNKFDDYLASSARVLTSPSLVDIAKFICDNPSIGILVEPDQAMNVVNDVLHNAKELSVDEFDLRQKLRMSFSYRTTMAPFIEWLRDREINVSRL